MLSSPRPSDPSSSACQCPQFSPACPGSGFTTSSAYALSSVQPCVCGGAAAGTFFTTREQRFSPACAGSGTTEPPRLPTSSVLPRVCGERASTIEAFALACGSAPRGRGTGFRMRARHRLSRFSPAWAGNGPDVPDDAKMDAVQPRVCGEQRASSIPAGAFFGSAPRVRGAALLALAWLVLLWFSPACAGSSARRHVSLP